LVLQFYQYTRCIRSNEGLLTLTFYLFACLNVFSSTDMNNKERKIALVTGGNRGLGYETCRQLSQSGLRVLLGARDLTKCKSAAYQLNEKEGLDVVYYQLDVSDENSISNVVL
jgi:FlaA1/EpsC-like NDP-sugar epimerase